MKYRLTSAKRNLLIIHMLATLAIIAMVTIYMLVHWYPQQFMTIEGGWKQLQVFILVTLFFGPFLSWLFVEPEIATFKKALMLVVVVQLGASLSSLLWIDQKSPEVAVYYGGKFHTLDKAELKQAKARLVQAGKQIASYKVDESYPIDFVYLEPLPDDQYMDDIMDDLPEYPYRPDRFRSIDNFWEKISANEQTHEQDKRQLIHKALMAGIKVLDAKVECYRLKGKYGEVHVLLDANTRKFLTTLSNKVEEVRL